MARYLLEECDLGATKVKNFATVGTPNMGIAKIPDDTRKLLDLDNLEPGNPVGKLAKVMTNGMMFLDGMQKSFSFAGYFRDPSRMETYLQKSSFLAKINNEVRDEPGNDIRRKKFMSVNKLMLVKFTHDGIVRPAESEWFGEYLSNQKTKLSEVKPWKDTDFYKQDWLGLKTLDQQGKITLVEIPRGHTEISKEDMSSFIKFLKS